MAKPAASKSISCWGENNGGLYLEAMFCPNVPVDSVEPYIILTFLSSTGVRIFSQNGFFCVPLGNGTNGEI